MYGLTQEGSLSNKILHKRLAEYSFSLTPHTPVLWRHDTRPIQLVIVVDYFGVEYERKEDAKYLLDTLNAHYKVVVEDWEGNIFCSINLEWGYK